MRKGPVSRMSRLRLKNFKSVGDSSPELGGLTVVVGPNSSGKTTLIQSLLLRVLPSGRISWTKEGMVSLNDEMTGLGTFDRIRRESAPDEEPLVLGGELEFRKDGLEEGWLRGVNTDDLDFVGAHSEDEQVPVGWALSVVAPEDRRDRDTSKAMVSSSRIYCGSENLERRAAPFMNPEDSIAYLETGFADLASAPRPAIEADERAYRRRRAVQFRRKPTKGNGTIKHPVASFFWNPGVTVAYSEARDGLPERVWLKDSARAHVVDGILIAWDRRAFFALKKEGELEFDEKVDRLEGKEAKARLVDQASKWADAYLQLLEEQVGADQGELSAQEPWIWFDEHSRGPMDDEEELELQLAAATQGADGATDEANIKEARRRPQPGGNLEMLAQFFRFYRREGGPQEIRERILQGVGESSFTEVIWEERDIGEFFSNIANIVSAYFDQQVFHLGPLREPPSRHYGPGGSINNRSVGVRGEATVSRLLELGRETIECPTGRHDRLPTRKKTLRAAVNHWMGEEGLGLFSTHQVKTPGGLVYTFSMKLPGVNEERYLNEVGVGVSQVLPVVVQCLLAEPGSLVLLQQPELHGHPGLQQKLADFLLACVRSGRQIILETHSEYLVSRLALRVAEDQSDETRDQVVLLLARQGESGTEYTKADLDRYGEIEWPEGFFDEGVSDALDTLKAGINKREGERGDSV